MSEDLLSLKNARIEALESKIAELEAKLEVCINQGEESRLN